MAAPARAKQKIKLREIIVFVDFGGWYSTREMLTARLVYIGAPGHSSRLIPRSQRVDEGGSGPVNEAIIIDTTVSRLNFPFLCFFSI